MKRVLALFICFIFVLSAVAFAEDNVITLSPDQITFVDSGSGDASVSDSGVSYNFVQVDPDENSTEMSPEDFYAGDDVFADAGQLVDWWYSNSYTLVLQGKLEETFLQRPYPAYVFDVYSTNGSTGSLTFEIVQGYEEQAEHDILRPVADKKSVTFADGGKYTMAELQLAQKEISAYMSRSESCITGCTLDMDLHCLVCKVDMTNAEAEDVVAFYSEYFGDKIAFKDGKGLVIGSDLNDKETYQIPTKTIVVNPAYLLIILVLFIAALSAWICRKPARAAAAKTSKTDKLGKTGKAEKTGKVGAAAKPSKADKPGKTGKAEKTGKSDSADKPNKAKKK